MASQVKTVVVVPNWDGEDYLADCLDSLQAQSYKDFQIIVVDNGSTDGSKKVLGRYPMARLIERDRNYGFVGGVNPGIELALAEGADFVVLFNNDAVADKHWLEQLVRAATEHPEAGITTSKILQMDQKRLDSTGDLYSWWGFAFPRGRDEVDQGQYDTPDQSWVFAGSGGASLYRASMLEQIGLFDQDFFAYYEDQDISFRAQLAGWRVWYEPSARVYHRMGGTSRRLAKARASEASASFAVNSFTRYHTIKNYWYLYLKNMPGWLFWKYLPRFMVGFVLILANSLKRGQFGPLARGLAAILIKTPATLAKRWHIQRRRTVPTKYIDGLLYKAMPPTQKTLLRLRQRLAGK